jgi:hypothetical protein
MIRAAFLLPLLALVLGGAAVAREGAHAPHGALKPVTRTALRIQPKPAAQAAIGRIVVALSKGPVNSFVPDDAFGAALDGMGKGEVEQLYTPFNIERMRSAGLKRISYRIRTELGIEAWHWNAEGTWSDPAHAQGYWTSSDRPGKLQRVTWGYNLPRRGDTIDQANNLGWSRLDDGDAKSFWKSNPYLDRRFTGAAESRPQWIAIDLDEARLIQAASIAWAEPFATHFQVQYWQGEDQWDPDGRWVTFRHGDIRSERPDAAPIWLADRPVRAQFLRIVLLQSSETAPEGATDLRDRLGYAVRELGFGVIGPDGQLKDVLRHGKGRLRQTVMHVSSTDPWHRASDRDPELEQPAFDLVFQSGVTNGLPMMVPVGVLYDTPDNAAAEIRWLKARGYPVTQVELGEEPDGQMVAPEDYADLYLQTAAAIRRVDPALKLGGPSLQSAVTDTWPDPGAGRSWTRRFIAQLKARGGLDQLNFFSFEHYPFDDLCGPLDRKLMAQTGKMEQLRKSFDDDGVPRAIPWAISEYGFSAYSGRAMSELPSALLDADIVGHFMTVGGSATYLFGYGPNWPINQHKACAGFGNMMLFQADSEGQAQAAMPSYWYARLLTGEWAQSGAGAHQLYPTVSDVRDVQGHALVTAYAVQRPDGQWAVMLVNRDAKRAHAVQVVFDGSGAPSLGGAAGMEVIQYSPERYLWKDDGPRSRPLRNQPPKRFTLPAGQAVDLPAYSLTVVRGAGPASGTLSHGERAG